MGDDITYPKLKILIEIYLANIKTKFDIRTLASYAEREPCSPYFREMLLLMKENNILVFIKKIGITSIYNIDKKALSQAIRETEIFNKIGKFIEKDTLLHNY